MVAMNVWPTDASDGSVATEARWRKMARQWMRSGVVDNVGGEMAPSLAFPNLTVQAGAAWVDGHYCELLGSQVLTVTANGLVVVRFDPAANTAELLYRDGATTPTQNPTGIWEIVVASMSGSAMTDRRAALVTPNGYVDGGSMIFPATPLVSGSKILAYTPPPVDFATRKFLWVTVFAGSNAGNMDGVAAAIYIPGQTTQAAPYGLTSPPNRYGHTELNYNWAEGPNGAAGWEVEVAWSGTTGGTTFVQAWLTWQRFRAP